jgi:caffeoyl-CoA O-methyltransferase
MNPNNNELLNQYLEEHTSDESEVLKYIVRETYLHQIYPRMISGKVQGKFLEMISLMIRPDRILEIGTFTAYATVCLAQGLTGNGIITTIEINPELEDTIVSHLERAGILPKTRLIIGNAVEEIPKLSDTYDLVFLDADKEQYVDYFKTVLPLVKQGGFILVDNVLWGGKVLEPQTVIDKETSGIMAFNDYVVGCDEVEVVMLPIRDGVSLIRKKN